MAKVNPTHIKQLRLSAAAKRYLQPWPGGHRTWKDLTTADLAAFRKEYGKYCKGGFPRKLRRDVQASFGKPPEALSLAEFRDYHKPNFHAQFFLGPLWRQLSPPEQELIKQMNEWTFIFVVGFSSKREFHRVCADRLRLLFKRKFRVSQPPAFKG